MQSAGAAYKEDAVMSALVAVSYTHLDRGLAAENQSYVCYAGTPQTGQGHLRRRAAVSGLLGADGFLKRQTSHSIPDGVQNAEPVPQKSPASADPWAAFGKAVGCRREVCGRTHPDNFYQPDSQQD